MKSNSEKKNRAVLSIIDRIDRPSPGLSTIVAISGGRGKTSLRSEISVRKAACKNIIASFAMIVIALLTGGCSQVTTTRNTPQSETARKPVEAKKPDYSPYPDQKFPNRVYWGVAHVHTGYSFDSGMFGVTTTPDDLFRVARGGEVVLDNGQRFKQDRPLDWVSITDHAEYMGISDQIRAGSPELLASPQGKRWYEMSRTSPQEGVKAAIEAVVSMQSGKPVFDASKLTAAAWAHAISSSREVERAGRVHNAARLRVDQRARRQQPSSHGRFPRRRGQGESDRSLFHLRQPGSSGPLEVHGRVREKNRRRRCSPSRTTAT